MELRSEFIHWLASEYLGRMLSPDALDDLMTWIDENQGQSKDELIDIIKDWKPQ